MMFLLRGLQRIRGVCLVCGLFQALAFSEQSHSHLFRGKVLSFPCFNSSRVLDIAYSLRPVKSVHLIFL